MQRTIHHAGGLIVALSLAAAAVGSLPVAAASPASSPAAPAGSPSPASSPVAAASPSPASSPVAAGSPSPASSPVAAGSPSACPSPSPSASSDPGSAEVMPQDYRLALFDGVWKAINDSYLDPAFNGVDWQAISDQYAPEILHTQNANAVYALLQQMVDTLGDPYTGFIPPPATAPDPSASPVPAGYVGVGVLVEDKTATSGDGFRILYVFPGSGAEKAGLRPRDRIVSVDGDACPKIATIRGPADSVVQLGIVTPGEPVRTVAVTRGVISGAILPIAERLPADPGVGYLRIIQLGGQDASAAIHDALASLLPGDPLKGVILDLRHVSVNAAAVMVDTLGHFVSGDVGTVYARSGTSPLNVTASDLQAQLASVPVAVLVDAQSQGEAEELAAILQAQHRVTVIGQQTPGVADGVQQVPFPDGSILQVLTYGFKLPDGSAVNGHGVTPDITVDADWLDQPRPATATSRPLSTASATLRRRHAPSASPAGAAPDKSLPPAPRRHHPRRRHGPRNRAARTNPETVSQGASPRDTVAGDLAPVAEGDERWLDGRADALDGDRAAWVEGTAAGQRHG